MKYIKAHFALLALVLVFNVIGNILMMPFTAHAAGTYPVYRLYNKKTGEHFYTKDPAESQNLLYYHGWDTEGEGFYGEAGGLPVYRLSNPSNGDHHYTLSEKEKDVCVSAGWRYEGVAWEACKGGAPVYRLFNPNKTGVGAHHYTLSLQERDALVKLGWKYESVSWNSADAPSEDADRNVRYMTDEEKRGIQRQFAEEIVALTNVERKKAGLQELKIDETFMSIAMQRAKEASVNYGHTRPNGQDCESIIYEYGIEYKNYNGENIGAERVESTTMASDQVNGWMNSPGHKRNILRETSDTIGVGCYIADDGLVYCVQFFGNLHTPLKLYTWDEGEIIIPVLQFTDMVKSHNF